MPTPVPANKLTKGAKLIHPTTHQRVEFVEIKKSRHKEPWTWLVFTGYGVSGKWRIPSPESLIEVV